MKYFKLTHEKMTRFVMTLEQSVDLIEYAILHDEIGYIIIPNLVSCKVKDLIEIFSEIYNKPVILSKLRPGEKLLESLINETQSMRVIIGKNGYMHIKPCYKDLDTTHEPMDYNSKINPMHKQELRNFLGGLNLI